MESVCIDERCWAEIDLKAMLRNHDRAKLLCPHAEILCVLKGNAYGCGLKSVSKALYNNGARWFAVACASEAVELLNAVPQANVLILGYVTEAEIRACLPLGVRFTLYSDAQQALLKRVARELHCKALVHIKVNTGLNRLGFDLPLDLQPDAEGNLIYEGLYTHLALHNAQEDEKQFERFDRADEQLRQMGIDVQLRHICDSIGMVRYPHRHMDLVRTGAWLYGVCPSRYPHPEECEPVVRFCTRIAQIHNVPAGEYIGYDDDHTLARDSRIATLCAGYADGTQRLNHTGFVIIRGQRAKVLGLVCMDMMMVDITDIPEAREGDEAVLLGDGITVDEYASWNRINRNEALCRITPRAKRIYRK